MSIDWAQTKLRLTAAKALDVAKRIKLQEINAACDKVVGVLTATYPQSEIQS